MATLTAAWGLGGFGITCVLPSLALLSIPMSLSHVHRHGLTRDHVGGRYLSTSTCYGRLLSGHGVDQVRPCHSFAALRGLTASRWKEPPLCSFPHTDCPIRQAETGVDFPVGCHLLRLDSPLISQSQARRLGGLPRPSPRLSRACCSRAWSVPSRLALTAQGLPDRTQGDFSHSMAMLHGAP
jgi:hypothetical protein